ncbi:hypothetical protein LSO9J_80047 [Candidatus Liberibacter solanacearum]
MFRGIFCLSHSQFLFGKVIVISAPMLFTFYSIEHGFLRIVFVHVSVYLLRENYVDSFTNLFVRYFFTLFNFLLSYDDQKIC